MNGEANLTLAGLLNTLLIHLDNISNPNDSSNSDSGQPFQVSTGLVVLLTLLYGSISLIAVIGNGLVIFVIIKDKRMQTVTNIFIANLAFADVIIGLFTTPFQFQAAVHQRWDLPYFLCRLAPSVKVLSVSVSVLTLTVISIDRYVAVLHPLKAGFSKKSAFLGLCLIWLIGILSSLPEGIFYRVEDIWDLELNDYLPVCDVYYPSETFGTLYQLYLLLVQYLLPLCVISISYCRVAHTIWGTKAPGHVVDRDNVRQRNKRKVVKMLIIVVCLFVLCWMPLQTYKLVSVVHMQINEYQYIHIIWFCCNWLAMSNSCYNPFIYGLLNEKFKREYRLLFSKMKCLKGHGRTTDNSDDSNNGGSCKRIRMSSRNNNMRPYPPPHLNGYTKRYRLVLGGSGDSVGATSHTDV